jgi:hypothetical protein
VTVPHTQEAVMVGSQAIEVPLPEGAEPTADERALLEELCRTIVGLQFDGHEPWRRVAGRLECAGWNVHWRVGWIAEARREDHFERGVGRSLDEAFVELEQLTLLDEVEGCP